MIENEWRRIVRAEAELYRAKELPEVQRRLIFERLALDFRRMGQQHRNIDAHVQYNRFWQAAIAADRAGYDRATALHDEVLERHGILEGLKRLDTAFGQFIGSSRRFHGSIGLVETNNRLRRREALLTQRINNAMSRIRTPGFVVLDHRPHEWIFRVPMYTDIEQQDTVESVKRIIEATWQLRDGKNLFRVELEISYISTDLLYADTDKPIRGQKVDVLRHVRRFPSGGAILTTGALTTHVQDYAIVLGPHPVAPRVIAHEFGHVLGFSDNYVRGYKDLGEMGFQIMEVVAEPNDLMAAPASGSVLPGHFKMLLNGKQEPKTPTAPEREIFSVRGRSPA